MSDTKTKLSLTVNWSNPLIPNIDMLLHLSVLTYVTCTENLFFVQVTLTQLMPDDQLLYSHVL